MATRQCPQGFDIDSPDCTECECFGDCLDESFVSQGFPLFDTDTVGPIKLLAPTPGGQARARRRERWRE